MGTIRAFVRFCCHFVVGEDWRVAAGVVLALAATAMVVQAGVDAWWLMPAAVVLLLGLSLRRALTAARRG